MTMIILIGRRKRFLVDPSKDFDCEFGHIKKEDLAKIGSQIRTNTGERFLVVQASTTDMYRRLKKRAQTIPLKDLAYIAAYTGIDKSSIVAEAGTGSGAGALFFARFVKKVYSFDNREEHQAVARGNLERMGYKNVVMKIQDVYEKFPVKNANLILLDLASPWEAIPTAKPGLAINGWLVSYSPSIPQISDFREALRAHPELVFDHVAKIHVEEWDMEGRVQRPLTRPPMGHSGFLCFARKMQ